MYPYPLPEITNQLDTIDYCLKLTSQFYNSYPFWTNENDLKFFDLCKTNYLALHQAYEQAIQNYHQTYTINTNHRNNLLTSFKTAKENILKLLNNLFQQLLDSLKKGPMHAQIQLLKEQIPSALDLNTINQSVNRLCQQRFNALIEMLNGSQNFLMKEFDLSQLNPQAKYFNFLDKYFNDAKNLQHEISRSH